MTANRNRTTTGALAFGLILAGALGWAIVSWLTNPEIPRHETMQVVFMTLTSGAVVGIFVGIVRSDGATTRAEVLAEMSTLRERLDEGNTVVVEAVRELLAEERARTEQREAARLSQVKALHENRLHEARMFVTRARGVESLVGRVLARMDGWEREVSRPGGGRGRRQRPRRQAPPAAEDTPEVSLSDEAYLRDMAETYRLGQQHRDEPK